MKEYFVCTEMGSRILIFLLYCYAYTWIVATSCYILVFGAKKWNINDKMSRAELRRGWPMPVE